MMNFARFVYAGKTGITPPEWKLDESAICGPTGTGQTPSGGESTDLSHIRGTPPGGSSSGDQTSMGLLPQEYLAGVSNYSMNNPFIFYLRSVSYLLGRPTYCIGCVT